jgi:anti-repressor protein
MNGLIRIDINEQQQPVISGRELHAFLGIDTEYSKWFPRMAEYGFSEGTDFSPILTESTGGRPATDHALTLGMAKHLCMIQRNPQGMKAREYFIAVENEYNSPEKIMARALRIADDTIKSLSTQIQIAAPKVEGYEALMSTKNLFTFREAAKLLGTGEKRLTQFLRDQNILMSGDASYDEWNIPYQRYIDPGYFAVKVHEWGPDGDKHAYKKTYLTQPGIDWVRKRMKAAGL